MLRTLVGVLIQRVDVGRLDDPGAALNHASGLFEGALSVLVTLEGLSCTGARFVDGGVSGLRSQYACHQFSIPNLCSTSLQS